jgi:membrane protease YdiL (CAAX protease family)
LPTDANPLIYKDYRQVPWWSLVIFLVAVPVLTFVGVRLMPDREMLTVVGAFFVAALLAAVIAVAPLGRAAFPALGLRQANWKYLVFGALGTLALSIGVSQFGIEPQGVKQVFEAVREPRQLAIALLLLAVLAPIVEEVVFRGLLYGVIAGWWGTLAAWLVSTLLFAAAHIEPAHVVMVLPLGLLFGWLRRRTDSLLPSLFSHIVNNGFALLAAVYLPNL